MVVIAVDGGQSGIRARVLGPGSQLLGAGQAPGFTYRVADPAAALGAGAREAIRDAGALPAHGPVSVAMGLSGLPPGHQLDAVVAEVASLLPHATVHLCGDHLTAHAGALGGAPGVAVAIGTGTVAVGLTAQGSLRTVDGWGYLVDDAGSGSWLGRAALRAALRDLDGRRPAPLLRALVTVQVGDLLAFHRSVHESDRPSRDLARLAPVVFEAAGDHEPAAEDILDAAVAELATSVRAAALDFPAQEPVAVAVTGGVAAAGEPLLARLARVLADVLPHAVLRPPAGDGLDGAVSLARGPAAHYRPHLWEYAIHDHRTTPVAHAERER